MMAKVKKKNFWEKLAEQEIIQQVESLHNVGDSDSLSTNALLSEQDLSKLKRISKTTCIKAGSAGALGVILLYLPYYLYGSRLFPETLVELPIISKSVSLEISFLIYSGVLVLLEIWYLTYINIQAVASIAQTCAHPAPNSENFETHLEALVAVSTERQQKQIQTLGIDPYKGLSRVGLFIFQSLIKLKAALSNALFTLLIKKLLGRYAIRQFVDFAGIPIYAFWNIWGSKKVMDEARIRAMAPPLIKRCTDLIYAEQKTNSEFRHHLFDTLQLVSESKRDFHFNHFLLSATLLNSFNIEITDEPVYNDTFIDQIDSLSSTTKDGIKKVFIFGIMIDGKISYPEKKALRRLTKNNTLDYSEAEILKWSNNYFHGKGMEEFFNTLFTTTAPNSP